MAAMKTSWKIGGIFLLLAVVGSGARAIEPDQAQLLYNQGIQQERMRQYAQAIASYSQAASLTDTAYKAFISRQTGNCYYFLGLTREALVAYNTYLAVNRDPQTLKMAIYLYKTLKAAPRKQTPVQTEKTLHPSEENRFGALWRSALIPGWGQWNRGDHWRGAAYFGVALVSFGLGYSTQVAADGNYESYKKTTDAKQASDLRGQVTSQDQTASIMLSVALAAYAANLADAFFFTSTPETTAWKPVLGPYGMTAEKAGASLAWSF
jgi:tetratricopeptide (TPR) repeat protein